MINLLKFFEHFELDEIRYIDHYEKAKKLINKIFKDKLDKGGNPYINHLYYVSNRLDNIDMKTVGLLHDLLEDTIITKDDLKYIGFSSEIIDAVELVTKKEDESYGEYIDRIIESNNMIAINVKLIDMENNMDLSRIKKPTIEDIERCENKYRPQYNKLVNYLKERENLYDRY